MLGLKAEVELRDERMSATFLKDFPLIFHDVLFLVLKDEVLIDHLHRH